jgi:hypothetical protein
MTDTELYIYILLIIGALVGIRFFWRRMKKEVIAPKQLRTYIRGQIAAVRDPVLLHYRTNPEVYGISDDVALSASILRTRVQLWKTILIGAGCFFFGMLIGSGM